MGVQLKMERVTRDRLGETSWLIVSAARGQKIVLPSAERVEQLTWQTLGGPSNSRFCSFETEGQLNGNGTIVLRRGTRKAKLDSFVAALGRETELANDD